MWRKVSPFYDMKTAARNSLVSGHCITLKPPFRLGTVSPRGISKLPPCMVPLNPIKANSFGFHLWTRNYVLVSLYGFYSPRQGPYRAFMHEIQAAYNQSYIQFIT